MLRNELEVRERKAKALSFSALVGEEEKRDLPKGTIYLGSFIFCIESHIHFQKGKEMKQKNDFH